MSRTQRGNRRRSKTLTRLGLLGVIASFVLVVAQVLMAPLAGATHVDPVFMEGNVFCEDVGLLELTRFDPPDSGTQDGVTISVSGATFSWSSTVGIDAVVVKGGPNANVYYYDEATSDSGLHAPINPNNGQPFGLSHISFCYDEDQTTTPPTTETTPPTTETTPPTTQTTPPTTQTTPPTTQTTPPTTQTTPPTTQTTETTVPTVAPTTITTEDEVQPTTVEPTSPDAVAFTGVQNAVPLGALALMLLTTGTGLMWAGSRRGRSEEDES